MKKGWQKKRLGDVTTKIGSGATPRGGDESYKAEGISLIRSLNVYDDGFREAKLARIDNEQADGLSNVVVEPHDVLLNITGASVARCCRAPADFLPARLNQHVSIIRPVQEKLDSDFLHYLLISKTYKDRLLHTGEEGGSTRQAITKAQLQEFVVEFPESLAEQQRIVSLLDEAFEGLATAKANAEKNLQNARALFESHLQSVFTQRGPGWVETTLEDICVKITDGEHLRPKVTPSGVPFLSAKDVLAHDVVFSDHLFVSEENAAKFRKRCNPEMGDILIVSRGATVGRTCVVKTDRIFCLLGSVILLKIHASQSSRFISYALKSPAIRDQLMTASEAAAQQAIYLRDIKPLEIGCPPVAVQQSIAEKLDALSAETQRLARIYERKLAALAELKKSLLHQAFTGDL